MNFIMNIFIIPVSDWKVAASALSQCRTEHAAAGSLPLSAIQAAQYRDSVSGDGTEPGQPLRLLKHGSAGPGVAVGHGRTRLGVTSPSPPASRRAVAGRHSQLKLRVTVTRPGPRTPASLTSDSESPGPGLSEFES